LILERNDCDSIVQTLLQFATLSNVALAKTTVQLALDMFWNTMQDHLSAAKANQTYIETTNALQTAPSTPPPYRIHINININNNNDNNNHNNNIIYNIPK
jgi:hypothetical protein